METRRKKTRRLAICAILSALGVVILYLGALVEVLGLSVAAIASLLCVLAVLEMGGAWPWLIYFVVAILSLVLLPVKSAAVIFALFAGYYPILKAYYERLRPIVSWILKMVNFNVALAVLLWLSLLFTPEAVAPILVVAMVFLGNAFFVLYDIALTRLISMYLRKLRGRLGIKKW